MVQVIEQSDPFGKIGKAFGKGLGEQIPTEVGRYRLSQGLQKLQQTPQNDPIARYSALVQAGASPEQIQQITPYLEQQNQRAAYRKKASGGTPNPVVNPSEQTPSQRLDQVKFANLNNRATIPTDQVKAPSDYANAGALAAGQEAFNEQSPVRESAVPRNPWTKERRDEEIASVMQDFPTIPISEARTIAADNEARELSQPEAEQNRDAYYKKVQDESDAEFDKKLETKLQKKGAETFSDLTGEMQLELKKKMRRDIIKNNMPIEKAADKWTQIALDQAKAKTNLETLSHQGVIDSLNKENTLSKLKQYGKIYGESGNRESFYNFLKTNAQPEQLDANGKVTQESQSGFGLSPQAAAWVAYPRSKSVQEEISRAPKSKHGAPDDYSKNARRIALSLSNAITSEDSILAIAKDLSNRDPFFDQHAFFEQLREDQDEIGLTPRQRKELGEGESSIIPNWGDLWVLPIVREGLWQF